MNQENFWILLSKKLANEASISELKELEELIHENPDWQYAIQNIEDLWRHKAPNDDMQTLDAYMLHLQRMKDLHISFGEAADEVSVIGHGRRKVRWYWAAAAVTVLAGLFLFLRPGSKSDVSEKPLAREVNEITTRPGSKSKVELPDGSIVWLNAGSKLTYNKDYGQTLREVTLSGEGYFDVMKMKEKPFIIHTSSINIKVLGTVFNVKAYPEDKHTETSLIRGSIEVTIKKRPNDKIILSPNEKLVVENSGIVESEKNIPKENTGSLPISTLMSVNKLKYNAADSTVAETEWIKNKLVFRDESFGDLAMRMERWYDVEIEITDTELKEEHLNGTFDEETIIQAMDALKEFVSFHYEQKGKKIIINR
ncbi:MAG: FecR family protein [Sphingobacteriales bacterium]|nr:FecR family protein [Sphingobacteriales bacterium]